MANYNFDEIIDRHNTNSLKWDFNIERKRDKDLLPFWVADMDFKLPEIIINPIIERVKHGIFGYSEPKDDYYLAVHNWFLNQYGINIDKSNIIVGPSVVFSICTLIKILTEKNDAIIINEPVYYPFKASIISNNRKCVSADLILKDGNYIIDFDDFEKKIVDNNVKLYILCNPHNPVGRVWNLDELNNIVRICNKHNVFIISDEIHADFVYNTKFNSIGLFNNKNTVIVSAPTKTFNIPGLKISNTIIYDKKIYNNYLLELDRIGYSQQSVLGLVATTNAYNYGLDWVKEVKEYIYNNILYIDKYLKEKLPKIKLIIPEGTYLIWLDFKAYNLSHKEIDNIINNKAKLWLDSGIIFGKSGSGFERINVATNRDNINKMLEALYNAFKEL